MGGFFGVVSSGRCAEDLFYGTDYHSHLGNQRGGLLVHDGKNGFTRFIHDIRNSAASSNTTSNICGATWASGRSATRATSR